MKRAACLKPMTTLVLWCATMPVEAAWTYAFEQDNYTVLPNGAVTVNVYLQETETTTLEEGVGVGLAGVGVKVVFNDPPQPSSPAQILGPSDIANTSDFPDTWEISFSAGAEGGLLLGASLTENVYGVETPASSGAYRALIGTFTFTAGAAAGESTLIRATDYAATNDTITGDLEELDASIDDGHATITTTPEPGSLALLGTGGILATLLGAYRRMKIGSNRAAVWE